MDSDFDPGTRMDH